jgi:signal transduction histidine kinase/CheY-like chemotaxis protein
MVLGGILILLVPMTIIGSVTFIKSTRTLEEISKRQLIQVAESLAGMIRITLEKDLRNLTTVAADPLVIRDALSGEYSTTQAKLRGLYPILSADFEGIAVYDTEGVLRADGVDISRVGISISERNYFRAAVEGKTGVGPMVPSKVTGAPIFGLSAPIISREGKFIGGVLGIVKADYLMKFISSIALGQTGYVFMVDQEGTVIAHPEEENILKKNIHDETGLEFLAEEMIRQKTEAVEYLFRGEKKVIGITPITLTGWSIGASQYRGEIMSLAYANMNFLLLVSCIFVILIILAVLVFSKTISMPVQTAISTLNHAIGQAAEAFVIIGPDGNVRFANPAMAAIVELPESEIVGNPFPPGNSQGSDTGKLWKPINDGTIWNGHITGTRGNGAPYTLDFTVTPVRGPVGKLMYYLAVGRDITRELAMQEQLQQSQKMEAIGTLAGGIAHDFNNILSAIFGYTELALESLDDREGLEDYLKEILGSAKRARDLVSHILTFSRKANLENEPLIPRNVIRDVAKLLRASLPATIEIRTSLNSSAAVLGNTTQIHQMVMNLCTNAGYAMKKTGGTLEITLDEATINDTLRIRYPHLKQGKYLQLKIADTGGGIPADVLERIFEPFYTTKPTGEGTGLGLSVVHGIAKSLGGEIMVESELGKGATFTILLPIVEAELLSPGEKKHGKLPGGSERILLVDDEAPITRSAQSLMEGLGYGVRACNRSETAWEVFSTDPDAFDIIVTDYTMPRMTGVALSEKVRTLRPDIPIILCSGNLALKEGLEELHPIKFVRKPVTAGELARAIRKMLDEKPPTPAG